MNKIEALIIIITYGSFLGINFIPIGEVKILRKILVALISFAMIIYGLMNLIG
jgi:hypothetical protein